MAKISTIILFLFILISCGSVKKIDVSSIRTIYLEHNPILPLNYGGKIEGKIKAITTDGEEIDITNNRHLTLTSNDVVQRGKVFEIVKHPSSFNDQFIRLSYTYVNKEEVLVISDSIQLNLRGDLRIDGSGADGLNGVNQSNRSTPLVFRDGKDGEHGTDGQHGSSAENYIGYIWKEGSDYYVYVQNIITKEEWKYISREPSKILFDLSGGDGGNGGNGGDGSNGKDGELDGEKSKRPGNGGNAGNGGSGGNGGSAGSIVLFLHSNAAELESKISFDMSAGNAGRAGEKGKPGLPGKALAGQVAGIKGRIGVNGLTGMRGQDGQVPEIAIQEFDFSGYE